MPTPSRDKKAVEVLQQIRRGAAFFDETGLICPSNSPLNGILIETPEYIF